jgi:ceramide glucosyltransferase
VTFGFPIAFLSALFLDFSVLSLSALGLTFSTRLFLKHRVDGIFGAYAGPAWLLPARDLLSFSVFIVSQFGETVHWRGSRFSVEPSGALSQP